MNRGELQAAYDVFNSGDIEAFIATLDPAIELVEHYLPDRQVYGGHDGIRVWWERTTEVLADGRFTVEDFEERDGWLFARVTVTSRGVGTGIEGDARVFHALHWGASSKLDYVGAFATPEEAEAWVETIRQG